MSLLKIILALAKMFALFKVFEKLGEKAWKSLVPIYNEYIVFKKTYNLRMFWIYTICDIISSYIFSLEDPSMLLMVVSIVAGIAVICIQFKYAEMFAKAFGMDKKFAWITFLVPAVAYIMVGFRDDIVYLGNRDTSSI